MTTQTTSSDTNHNASVPREDETRWAYQRGGGWSGEPHETVYMLDRNGGTQVVLSGHLLGR